MYGDFFIQIIIDNCKSKQYSPWSDATLYGVWSGSALYAYMRMPTSASVYGYKCASACGYVRAYLYARACVRVSVRLVCVCMYTSVTILMSYV